MPVKGTMITTVQSPVVLVARADAPDTLITATLESLYRQTGDPPLTFLMSRKEATIWVKDVLFGMHPAAKRFLQTSAENTQAP